MTLQQYQQWLGQRPPYEEWLRERLNWFERLRAAISPTDERLDFIALTLVDILEALAAGAPPVTVSLDHNLEQLIANLGRLNTNLSALITLLGGEVPPELPGYEFEQIRKVPPAIPAIAPGQRKVIWETELKEKGTILAIKLVSDLDDVIYSLFIDESREIIFKASELQAQSIEHPYPFGAWIEKADGSFVVIISGWGVGGLTHERKFRLRAENTHATSTLNISLLDLLRRKVV